MHWQKERPTPLFDMGKHPRKACLQMSGGLKNLKKKTKKKSAIKPLQMMAKIDNRDSRMKSIRCTPRATQTISEKRLQCQHELVSLHSIISRLS